MCIVGSVISCGRKVSRNTTVFRLWGLFIFTFLLPPALNAANNARWTTNYYSVSGSTIREIKRSMTCNRPAQVSREGLTEWNIRWRFAPAKLQGNYRCSGFTTTTTIRITLPRWTPPAGVSDSVKQEWDRYIILLKQHEAGHGQIAMAAAGELHRRAGEIGTSPDPDALKSTVDNLMLETLREFHERDREYDRLTNHGVDQGATLAGHSSGLETDSFSRRARRMREKGR